MKYPKISVVVPIYNVESYLEKSLDSILNQDYPNLEIILIDDCSKDSSYSIAKKYQKKDKRIVLLQNPKNRGLSFTRNRGIEVATGDYIGFIDSDDTIPTNYTVVCIERFLKIKQILPSVILILFTRMEIRFGKRVVLYRMTKCRLSIVDLLHRHVINYFAKNCYLRMLSKLVKRTRIWPLYCR